MEAIVGKITTMLKSKLSWLKGKALEQGKRKVMKYKDKLPTEDQITEKQRVDDPDLVEYSRMDKGEELDLIFFALKAISTILLFSPLHKRIPLHEWIVRALHNFGNNNVAHPVNAQTWTFWPIRLLKLTKFSINFVFPVPPGPVINKFFRCLNNSNA